MNSTRCCSFAIRRSTSRLTRGSAAISASCISTQIHRDPKDILKSCQSTPMRIRSASMASTGTRMSHATKSRPWGSILYLHTVPGSGGDTLFASQFAAYDALSPRLRAYLEGLTATHSGGSCLPAKQRARRHIDTCEAHCLPGTLNSARAGGTTAFSERGVSAGAQSYGTGCAR